MEIVYQWLIGIFGGLGIGGIITAIILGMAKGIGERVTKKLNVEKIAENAVEKGIGKVKTISYEQSIQPVVESELVKINEKSSELVKQELAEVKKEYQNLIAILKSLASYFDDSFGVPEYKKQELHKAIEQAENKAVEPQKIVVSEENTEIKNEPAKPQNEVTTIR